MRVGLTWNEQPSDLDSHLTGPDGWGGRFHVYYSYRGGRAYALLDHDDIDSYGPETITIVNRVDGVYRYSVHDFTNRDSTYSTALASSGARVRIYTSAGQIADFAVPYGEGNLWTVFEMDGATINPVNTLSYYQSYPDAVWAPPLREARSWSLPEKQ